MCYVNTKKMRKLNSDLLYNINKIQDFMSKDNQLNNLYVAN